MSLNDDLGSDPISGWIQLRIGFVTRSRGSDQGINLEIEPPVSVDEIVATATKLISNGRLPNESGCGVELDDPNETFTAKLRAVSLLLSDLSNGRIAVSIVGPSGDLPEDVSELAIGLGLHGQ